MNKRLSFILAVILLLGCVTTVSAKTEPVYAEIIYENDFSESRGWFWQKYRENNAQNEFPTGFDAEKGAYTSYPYSTTRLSYVKPDFRLETGKTYEISFRLYSGQNQTNYLSFNFGNNKVYVKTADGSSAPFSSSYAWWADDVYHPNIGNCWYTVKYRFTVDRIVGSDGTTALSSTGLEYMEFVCAADSTLRFKDLKISRLNGISTAKTIAGDTSAPGNQKLVREGFAGEENGVLSVDGTEKSVPVSLTLRKGAAYRISYYAKTTDAEGVYTSISAGDSRVSFAGIEGGFRDDVSVSKSGKWEHFCYFLEVTDIRDESGGSLDSCTVRNIAFGAASGTVQFDDYFVMEYVNTVKVAADASAGGTVSDSSEREFGQYGEAVYTVTPDEGLEVNSIEFCGAEYSGQLEDLSQGGTVRIPVGANGGTVRIAFGKPLVENVRIKGTAMSGEKLSVYCGAAESSALVEKISYNWEISGNGSDGWAGISAEKELELTDSEIGKYVRCRISVKRYGQSVETEKITDSVKIVSKRELPVAAVSGIAAGGGVYEVLYTCTPAGITPEITWEYSSDKASWTVIDGETAAVFSPRAGLQGMYIRAGVTPVDADGIRGETVYSTDDIRLSDEIILFVANDGDDLNAGSLTFPFATVAKALKTVRELRADYPDAEYRIYLREGEYTEKVSLSAGDSGTEGNPLVISAYGDEKVTFFGGKRIESIMPAEASVKAKVIDKTAADKLMKIDLDGITGVRERADYIYAQQANGSWVETFGTYLPVYVNGNMLSESRWPDAVEDELKIRSGGEGSAVYTDSTGRAALWSADSVKSLRISGHINNWWSYADLKVTSISPAGRSFTTNTGSFASDHSFYFYNIPEEIDVPGESWLDAENNALYFYPFCDMETAEVIIPSEDEVMLTVDGASDITVSGIDFKYSVNKLFDIKNSDSITLDDCEFAYFFRQNNLNGTNLTMKNCYMHDAASGGVITGGGDRNSLTPSGNVIENCRITNCDMLKKDYSPAIHLGGVAVTVKNCEIAYGNHELIAIDGQNHVIKNNEIHHGVQWAGDMGAIYWGRSPKIIGLEIDGNYFHDNASECGNGWAQSVFWDDGAIGPYMHHNIIYRGTLTSDRGGNMMAVKTHGGQYSTIENNLFVDNPYAVQFQSWAWNDPEKREIRWWKTLYDVADTNYSWLGQFVEVGFYGSGKWVTYYKDSHWSGLTDSFDLKFYEDNMASINKATEEGKAQIDAFARQYAPVNTNIFENNAIIKPLDAKNVLYPEYAGSTEAVNTFVSESGILPSGNPMFKNYGVDFTLTDEGLAAIREDAPGFTGIVFSEMGIKPFVKDGKEYVVGGDAPLAGDAEITGTVVEGNKVTAKFSYYGSENKGNSRICWYSSGSKLQKLGCYGETLEVTSSMVGKKILFSVTPVDENGRMGETVWSSEYVVKPSTSALEEVISKAEKLLSDAVVGTEPGNYPADAADALSAAVQAAKSALQSAAFGNDVTDACAALEKAVKRFESRAVKDNAGENEAAPGGSSASSRPSFGGGGGGGSSSGSNVNYVYNEQPQQPESGVDNGAARFADITGHWAEADILAMYEKGIVSGVTENSFEPDRSITRAEFATLVVKALGLEGGDAVFADVKSDDWFAPFVGAAAKEGIIVGSDGAFRPGDTITREEMAVIIVKAYEYLGKTAAETELLFEDNSDISNWAEPFVSKAVGAGLISGMGNGEFAPSDNATRAQSVSIINRILK